jgi:TIR domain-containing protein/SIR2-like protein
VETNDPRDTAGGVSCDRQVGLPLKVFLNYRHEDTHATAWALYMKLEERFGAENVFFDDGSLRPGMRWSEEIKSQLADSDVVIALIGSQWISSLITRLQTGGEDYVVKEIDLALRSGPRVALIPVLVDNVELPDSSSLPPSLRALLRCQVERLRLTNLARDIDHLIRCLSQIPDREGLQGADLHSLQLPQRAPRRPSSEVAPAPDDDHYRMVAGTAGNLVVFLGSGANSDDDDGPWSAGSGRLPDDRELARFLATRLGLENAPLHLAEVAQYAGALRGEIELFQWVRQVLQVDLEPGPVHRYLAHLPAQLGRRCQMIVTPQYDAALEKAFTEAGEDFDVVVYMAPGTEQAGRFVHLPWDAFPRPIDKPNEYTGLPIIAGDRSLRRTVIVRIGGTVDDPSAGFPWEDNYVITEDHYIDYLSGRAAEEVVPAQILAKLKRANYLFLGYTIADWRLRVFLQRIWKGPKLGHAKYWAVEQEPDALERDLWQQAGLSNLYQSSLTDYLRGLYDYLANHPEEAQP